MGNFTSIKYEKIILPYSPESINSVISYGVFGRGIVELKKRWQDIAKQYIADAVQEGILPERIRQMAIFRFKMYFEKRIKRDEDNYFVIAKAIIDEFVNQGIIEDDSSEYCHFAGSYLFCDKERPRVEIEVEERVDEDSLVQITYDRHNHNDRFNSFAERKIINSLRSSGLCSGDSEDNGDAESAPTGDQGHLS